MISINTWRIGQVNKNKDNSKNIKINPLAVSNMSTADLDEDFGYYVLSLISGELLLIDADDFIKIYSILGGDYK